MPIFTVHHTTTYRYRQPVGFGEHRLMLRPVESRDQRLLADELTITPEPASLDWRQDELGNWIGTARFRGRARMLCFRSTLRVDHTAWAPGDPLRPDGLLAPTADLPAGGDMRRFLQPGRGDRDGMLAEWARSFPPPRDAGDGLAALAAMTRTIHAGFTYLRREEKGIQEPAQTLARRSGSCRDFSVLMMEAARALRIPARFVSGYLHVPSRGGENYHGGGSTHAWVQAWLPGTGWTDFDPTNGIVGNRDLIRVAAAPEPAQVVPLSGTFIGFRSDQLAMEVSVRVESGDELAREPRCGVVA